VGESGECDVVHTLTNSSRYLVRVFVCVCIMC